MKPKYPNLVLARTKYQNPYKNDSSEIIFTVPSYTHIWYKQEPKTRTPYKNYSSEINFTVPS